MTPGPSYLPPPDYGHGKTISPKLADPLAKERSPPVGIYDPQFVYLPRIPRSQFLGPARRDKWLIENRDIELGPGRYSPKYHPEKVSIPRFSFGERSRKISNKPPRSFFSLGILLVKLDPEFDVDSVLRFLRQRRNPVKKFFEELINLVLLEQPEDVLAFFMDKFKGLPIEIKESQTGI